LRQPKNAVNTPEVRVVRMPFDPVLRQALIDIGVITLADLRAAEDKIMAINGGRDGQEESQAGQRQAVQEPQ
jgi:hypothetical protein